MNQRFTKLWKLHFGC